MPGHSTTTSDAVDTPATPETSVSTPAPPQAFRPAPRWAIIGIFLLLLVAAIAYGRSFLMPVVLAFLLAMVFSPPRRFMQRCGIPPGLSACLIVASLVTSLVAGVMVLAEPVSNLFENAPEIGREVERKLGTLRGSADSVIALGEQVNELTSSNADNVPEVAVREPGLLSSLADIAPSILAQSVFTLVLLVFLLSSGDLFYEKIVHVIPKFKDKRRAVLLFHGIERTLSRYLSTIFLINAGLGITIGIAMYLLGMPNPVLFGVIGFVFNFIPYLGALAGVLLATVVGLVSFEGVGQGLLPGLVYLGLTTLEGQFITPLFVSRNLKLNTVVVFLSVALWAWLWSAMGMLLAVPLLITIKVFCEYITPLEPIGYFLSARAPPPSHAGAALPRRSY